MRMRVLFLALATVFALSLATVARADVIAYISAGPAEPGNLDLSIPSSQATGSFDIYLRATELVAGASLNLMATGNSIDLVSATVPAYAPRWASAQVGPVNPDGSSILALDAFAIPGFGSNGINPASAGSDTGYNASINAFHYATVNYNVVGPGETTFKFVVGDIEFGVEGAIFLGTGDAAVALTGAGSAGATSANIDGRIVVQGGPVNNPPVLTALAPIDVAWPAVVTNLQLTATDDLTPVDQLVWSNLVADPTNPSANPGVLAPSLNADGQFSWNPTGAKGGTYRFSATVADTGNPALTDTDLALTINYTVPEPATLSLFGLALVGFAGGARRRG